MWSYICRHKVQWRTPSLCLTKWWGIGPDNFNVNYYWQRKWILNYKWILILLFCLVAQIKFLKKWKNKLINNMQIISYDWGDVFRLQNWRVNNLPRHEDDEVDQQQQVHHGNQFGVFDDLASKISANYRSQRHRFQDERDRVSIIMTWWRIILTDVVKCWYIIFVINFLIYFVS